MYRTVLASRLLKKLVATSDDALFTPSGMLEVPIFMVKSIRDLVLGLIVYLSYSNTRCTTVCNEISIASIVFLVSTNPDVELCLFNITTSPTVPL